MDRSNGLQRFSNFEAKSVHFASTQFSPLFSAPSAVMVNVTIEGSISNEPLVNAPNPEKFFPPITVSTHSGSSDTFIAFSIPRLLLGLVVFVFIRVEVYHDVAIDAAEAEQ